MTASKDKRFFRVTGALVYINNFFWVFYIRVAHLRFPFGEYPVGLKSLALNTYISLGLMLPGALFLHRSLYKKREKAFLLWLVTAVIFITPLIFHACGNITDNVVSAFILFSSLFWSAASLVLMVILSFFIYFLYMLGKRKMIIPVVLTVVLIIYPTAGSYRSLRSGYWPQFAAGLPLRTPLRHVTLIKAQRTKDKSVCEEYKYKSAEKECRELVGMILDDDDHPCPFSNSSLISFAVLKKYIDYEVCAPEDIEMRWGDIYRYIRNASSEDDCRIMPRRFAGGYGSHEDEIIDCRAYVHDDPSMCRTDECYIDFAIRYLDTDFCDKIKGDQAESSIGICYAVVELAESDLIN